MRISLQPPKRGGEAFDKEQELTEKTERLCVLNGLLNVDKKQNEIVDGEPDEGEEAPARKDKERER